MLRCPSSPNISLYGPLRLTRRFDICANSGLSTDVLTSNNLKIVSSNCVSYTDESKLYVINDHNCTTHQYKSSGVQRAPSTSKLAVQYGTTLKIVNVALKTGSSHVPHVSKHHFNEMIEASSWLDDCTLAVTTTTSVYHLTLQGLAGTISKLTDRPAKFCGYRATGYTSDTGGRYHGIWGTNKMPDGVKKKFMILDKGKKTCHVMEGTLPNIFHISSKVAVKYYVASYVDCGVRGELRIECLGSTRAKDSPRVTISHPAGEDDAVGIHALQEFGIVLLVTKRGYVHVVHVQSGQLLSSNYLGSSIVSCAVVSGECIVCTSTGEVCTLAYDGENEQTSKEPVKSKDPVKRKEPVTSKEPVKRKEPVKLSCSDSKTLTEVQCMDRVNTDNSEPLEKTVDEQGTILLLEKQLLDREMVIKGLEREVTIANDLGARRVTELRTRIEQLEETLKDKETYIERLETEAANSKKLGTKIQLLEQQLQAKETVIKNAVTVAAKEALDDFLKKIGELTGKF